MKKKLIALAILVGSQVQADIEHLGAHVHGEANMNVVLEGNTLKLSLEGSAINFLGFEHDAHTEEQKSHAAIVIEQLKNANDWLMINDGNCSLRESNVKWTHSDHDHSEHKDDGEHEHHNHHNHNEKKHDHSDESNHSDMNLSFDFKCKNPIGINKLEINLFEKFTGLEKISTQWIVGDKQGSDVLTKESNILKLNY